MFYWKGTSLLLHLSFLIYILVTLVFHYNFSFGKNIKLKNEKAISLKDEMTGQGLVKVF